MVTREQIEILKRSTFDAIKADGALTMLLLSTYGQLYRCVPDTCTKSMAKYHQNIIRFGIDKLKIMQKQTFILKKGVLIYDSKNHCHYSSSNMTDEVAKKLIKDNPRHIDKFEKVPEIIEKQPVKAKTTRKSTKNAE